MPLAIHNAKLTEQVNRKLHKPFSVMHGIRLYVDKVFTGAISKILLPLFAGLYSPFKNAK